MPSIVNNKIVWNNNGTADVTNISSFSGKEHTRKMQMTKTQYDMWLHTGALIQVALPQCNADDREFLMTGATPEEWEEVFGTEK